MQQGESDMTQHSSKELSKLRLEWNAQYAEGKVIHDLCDEIARLQAALLIAENERDKFKQQRADWKAIADSRPHRAASEPSNEHTCGTPGAMCDVDCMIRASQPPRADLAAAIQILENARERISDHGVRALIIDALQLLTADADPIAAACAHFEARAAEAPLGMSYTGGGLHGAPFYDLYMFVVRQLKGYRAELTKSAEL
jgi:hypothetical protein